MLNSADCRNVLQNEFWYVPFVSFEDLTQIFEKEVHLSQRRGCGRCDTLRTGSGFSSEIGRWLVSQHLAREGAALKLREFVYDACRVQMWLCERAMRLLVRILSL